jgi:Leucine-rich repeat (LRR) protein
LVSLKQLVSLDLHQNQFDTFYSVPASKQLDSIMLAFNRIDTLQNIDRASNITVLDLHNNKL